MTIEKSRMEWLLDIRQANSDLEKITLEYSGYGDELSFTEISEEGLYKNENELIDFLMAYVSNEFGSFWNNEGGQGSVTWNLTDDLINVEHGENYTKVDYYTISYGSNDEVK